MSIYFLFYEKSYFCRSNISMTHLCDYYTNECLSFKYIICNDREINRIKNFLANKRRVLIKSGISTKTKYFEHTRGHSNVPTLPSHGKTRRQLRHRGDKRRKIPLFLATYRLYFRVFVRVSLRLDDPRNLSRSKGTISTNDREF